MRETRDAQRSIFDFYSRHPIGQHLRGLSDLFDSYPSLLEVIEKDFRTQTLQQLNGLHLSGLIDSGTNNVDK